MRKIEVLGLKLKQADEEKPEEFSRGKNDSIEDFLHQKISYMTNSTLKLKQVNEEEKTEIEFLKGGKSDSKEDPLQLKVSYKTNSIQSSINNEKELNLIILFLAHIILLLTTFFKICLFSEQLLKEYHEEFRCCLLLKKKFQPEKLKNTTKWISL